MTLQQIREKLHEIATLAATDYEAAHAAEDELHVAVLQAIADDQDANLSVSMVRHMAWLALNTKHIDFERHAA